MNKALFSANRIFVSTLIIGFISFLIYACKKELKNAPPPRC
jgi:hypothetical protein